MKLSIFCVIPVLLGGCTLVPCNHTFPKFEWYWSQEAIDCRKMYEQEKQYQRTNTAALIIESQQRINNPD